MMISANPAAGRVMVRIGDRTLPISFSLGAVAALGTALKCETYQELMRAIQVGRMDDAPLILRALLVGNGHDVQNEDVIAFDFLTFATEVLPALLAPRSQKETDRPPVTGASSPSPASSTELSRSASDTGG